MSVREIVEKPEIMAHFPDGYRWLELSGAKKVYGYGAILRRDENLETHLSLLHWGPKVVRSLWEDLDWLKGEARRLGLKRILGIRADNKGEFDPKLFRFARMYGAEEVCVFQTISLNVD